MFYSKICFLSIFVFVCLATAQQQQQPEQNGLMTTGIEAQAPVTCNFTTVKAIPQTKFYSDLTCLVAKFAAYLEIGVGKFVELNNGTVDAKRSNCEHQGQGTVDQTLVVTFPCGEIQFNISRSTNGSQIFVKSIEGSYKINDMNVTFANSTPAFETFETGHYYKCDTEQYIPVEASPAVLNTTTHLVLSNFAYEAYRTATGKDFYKVPEECALDRSQVSYMTRIGVGVCLVVLAIIIIIAYFVGRRRWSERSSYESV